MKILFVYSKQDRAGITIRDQVLKLVPGLGEDPVPFASHLLALTGFDERLIYAESFGAGIDADLILFFSRHSSVNPVPVLTVHVTGNYRDAELGGTPRTLPPAAPVVMQAILRALKRNAPEGYRASYEVTHHGPTGLAIPSCFVEIGSTLTEWEDQVAGAAVAKSVVEALRDLPENSIPLIGFGGTHYAVRETEIALASRGAFGHIAHSREIPSLDRDMIRQMAERTGAVAAYIDKKSVPAPEVSRLTGILAELDFPVLSEGEIHDLGEIPWPAYREICRIAEEIDPKARPRLNRAVCTGKPVSFEFNQDLLDETLKADPETFFAELGKVPVVSLSTPARRILPVFISCGAPTEEFINALITLCVKLIRAKKTTAVERDHLIIREVRFDPEKARNLGLSQGPLFSRLAGGQAVEHDGREITPEMVQICRERQVHIPGLERYQ
ncbi:MAG: D-aminoacyl-tRNA deacylase [Methanoregulaceae archaeon]